jgi:hypothetical protein
MTEKTLMLVLAVSLTHCSDDDSTPETLQALPLVEVVKSLPADIITSMTEAPAADGALGRNKDAYFHVRFQLGIAPNAAYSIYREDANALREVARSITYSFERQKADGDFIISVPPSLQHLGDPSAADLASGTAFFGSALATGLNLFNQSGWFQRLDNTDAGKLAIADTRPQIQRMTDWLQEQTELLKQVDARAANRLLWDANCFYGLGTYLGDIDAQRIGEEFIREALALQHPDGYFQENEGFDSSYNGVSLLHGLQVFVLLPNGELKQQLGAALLRAAKWQITRIAESGEIITTGNTRVFPGGEEFLGEEKSVAASDTVLAFYWLNILSPGRSDYLKIAEKVKNYYF